MSQQRRFELKAGDHLGRAEAPAIAGRTFTITAKFDATAAKTGVLVAQGGSAQGYALYLAEGQLHFTVRGRDGVSTATWKEPVTGVHTVFARADAQGPLTLALDGQPSLRITAHARITTRPTDGLDVGTDGGGAVGPYSSPNKFAGKIESIVLELDAP